MISETNKLKIAVIGGGASGMLAAIFASGNNSEVTIFEAKDTLGKKINATGNGKCNFTNMKMGPEYYRGEHPEFAANALKNFDENKTIEFFKSIGILPKFRLGYVYPNSEQAASVSKALALTCKSKGVTVKYEPVTGIQKKEKGFTVNKYYFDKIIMACGSFAGMKNQDEFNGYKLVQSLGHTVTKLYPALVQLKSNEKFLKTLSGVRQEAHISLYSDGVKVSEEFGELLFSDKGISGIPSMQISRYASKLSDEGHKLYCKIDFFPEVSEEELTEELRKRGAFNRTAEEALFGMLNYKLNYVLLLAMNLDATAPAGKVLSGKNPAGLAKLMKGFTCNITGTNSFDMAQVVAGGVKTTEIDSETMESKIHKGLYFAGEIIDIDGTCGGYNLQWAWSSGYTAGRNAAK